MKVNFNIKKYFKVLLFLVGLHSFLVGILMIILPTSSMSFFGYTDFSEKFFQSQAGVFHIVMFIAYLLILFDIKKYEGIIYLVILSKLIAVIFLFSYFLFVDKIWMVLFSGVADLAMGAIMLLFFIIYKNEIEAKKINNVN